MNPPDPTVAVTLRGRRALVVGHGPDAAGAAVTLLRAGARVEVLVGEDPDADPGATLDDLAARGQLTVLHGRLDPAGYAVIAARTGSPNDDAQVEAAAAGAGTPVLARSSLPVPSSPRPPSSPHDELSTAPGVVTILGGGPGDPGLLTLAGYRALAEADVVVADRLAPLSVLDELQRRPQVIDAAKVPGGRSMPQEQINAALIEHATAGRSVVRLKGGDPFVFGRGMEEIQACAAAGLPTRVIPGVTSAIAVPGLVGVPVTHRGVVQAFTVVSGHVPPGHPDSQVDWAALARTGSSIVLLMAVATLPAIAAALIDGGLDPATPTATVVDGAGPHARTLRSTLAAIPTLVSDIRPPAVTVIGAVTDLDAPARSAPPAAGTT